MSVGLPQGQRAAIERAARFLLDGRHEEGRAALDLLLTGHGGRKAICWALAECVERGGRADLALSIAHTAARFDHHDATLWAYVARLADAAGHPRALAVARRAEHTARKLQPLLKELNRAERSGDDPAALAAVASALGVSPTDAWLWMSAGGILRRLGRHDEAVAAFESAAQRDVDGEIRVNAVSQIAGTLYGRGEVEAAIARFEEFDRAQTEARGQERSLLRDCELFERRAVGLVEHCERLGAPMKMLAPSVSTTVPSPDYHPAWDRDPDCVQPTPEIAVGELANVEVFSGAAIVTSDEHLVLPCSGLAPGLRQDNVPFYTGFVRGPHTLLRRPSRVTCKLERAVLLAGRGATNYFHFLLELLPRTLFARSLDPAAAELPHLVNEGMPEQHYQLLRELVPESQWVMVNDAARIAVDRLIVPSLGGMIPDDPRIPFERMMIAPYTVRALRQALRRNDAKPTRKVALRRRSPRRRCVNEPEILETLARRGFEIVDPLDLSFTEQLEMFGNAEVVVTTCGAAQTNVVWMAPNARLVVLWGESVRPSYFSELGRAAGVHTTFVRGAQVVGSHPDPIHRDFEVPLANVLHALGERRVTQSSRPKKRRAKKHRAEKHRAKKRRRAA